MNLEIAEFIYQAYVTGAYENILDLMDTSDAAFYEALSKEGFLAHDALREAIERDRL